MLPVLIPEKGKLVAVSFWFNDSLKERGRTMASGICLDLNDIKNKANLVEPLPTSSWLHNVDPDAVVSDLVITDHDHFGADIGGHWDSGYGDGVDPMMSVSPQIDRGIQQQMAMGMTPNIDRTAPGGW